MSILEKTKQWLIPKLIKLKFVKQVVLPFSELTDDIQVHLPFDIKFSVPNGNGFVIISSVDLTEYRQGMMKANLKGTLDIKCMGEHLYSSNIQIELFGKPLFIKEKSVIRATDVVIGQINLADDNLIVVHKVRKAMSKLSNNLVKNMYSLTMGTALGFIDNVTDMKGYIANFVNEKSHKILELHRIEIESNLIESLTNGDLEYALEEAISNESLFIKYGKDIIVENN